MNALADIQRGLEHILVVDDEEAIREVRFDNARNRAGYSCLP